MTPPNSPDPGSTPNDLQHAKSEAHDHDLDVAMAYLMRVGDYADRGELLALIGKLGYHQAAEDIRTGRVLPSLTVPAQWTDLATAERDVELAHSYGARLVARGDPGWPLRAGTGHRCEPVALWVRGSAPATLLTHDCVTFCGARNASPYGNAVTENLASNVAEQGLTVTALADWGIARSALLGALALERPAIAVLSGGIDLARCPSPYATTLGVANSGGLLVTACPPGATPDRARWEQAQWLTAALAHATVVVEADAHSTDLAVLEAARELGRAVLAAPGPLTSALSQGCHDLLRSRMATVVTSAADIVDALDATGSQTPVIDRSFSLDAAGVLAGLVDHTGAIDGDAIFTTAAVWAELADQLPRGLFDAWRARYPADTEHYYLPGHEDHTG